jgi:hypothetical protein
MLRVRQQQVIVQVIPRTVEKQTDMQRLAARRLDTSSGRQTQFLTVEPLGAVLLMAALPNLQRLRRQASLRRERRRHPG